MQKVFWIFAFVFVLSLLVNYAFIVSLNNLTGVRLAPRPRGGFEKPDVTGEVSLEERVRNYISSNKELGIKNEDIVLDKTIKSKQHGQDIEFVYFNQYHRNVPVYNSLSAFLVRDGEVVYAKSNYHEGVDLDVTPVVSDSEAFELAKNNIANLRSQIETRTAVENDTLYGYYDIAGQFREYDFPKVNLDLIQQPLSKELVVYPIDNDYYLAWKVDLPLIEELPAQFSYFVDAETGGIISVTNNILFYNVSGTVTGLEWEDPFTDGIQLEKPFAHDQIDIDGQTAITNGNGYYEFTGLEGNLNLTSYLEGPWVKVYNDQLDESVHSALISADTLHNWNWDYDDNSYLDEESNVFYHVNRIRDYAIFVGAEEMDFQMEAIVNINDHCNAYYSTARYMGFYEAGSGCESTGVINDVIYHEYGHGIVHELDPSLLHIGGYWDQSGNIHEALADYWACTLNDNPDIGEGFYAGNPNGLRICNSDDRYPEDYDPEPHSGCQIVSGAMWDIREILGKEYVDPLMVNALRLQPITFTELLDSLIIMDDDNGDLSDGTPNIIDICSSFWDNHGIVSSYCAGYTYDPLAIISYPSDNGVVNGIVNINGTAHGSLYSALDYYIIEYYSDDIPSSIGINLTNNGNAEVVDGVLGTLDTSLVSVVVNKLRLTVYTQDGESRYHEINVHFDPDWMMGWPAHIIGWPRKPSIGDLDNDGKNELIITSSSGSNGYLYVFQYNGLYFPGEWPKRLGLNLNSPAVADLNNDNIPEIIVAEKTDFGDYFPNGRVHVFEPNGSYLDGWPIILDGGIIDECSPSIADIDNDGGLEIIIGTGSSYSDGGSITYYKKMYAFHYSGDIVDGWPVELSGTTIPRSTPVLVDLDGDDKLEIIMGSLNYIDVHGSMHALHAFHYNGTIVSGFPYYSDYWNWAIAAGDVNNDGEIEILTHGNMIDGSGSPIDGWTPQEYVISFLALANVDDNDYLEIIYGQGVNGKVMVVDHNGNPLDGWPQIIQNDDIVDGNPVVGDIDGDGDMEILIGAYYVNKLSAWHHNGTVVEGFPKELGKKHRNLALADLDNDGDTEIISADHRLIYVWELPGTYNPAKMEWPMFQHDPQHTGLYIDPMAQFPCGDCNGDGRVTSADATYIINYIYRGGPAPIGDCDVNQDGRITAADATYIISYIYRNGPAPCEPP